jgi:hypothetical protein
MTRDEFVTWADGAELYRGDSLESAARAWDAATHTGPAPAGGVAEHSYAGDVMVRDGWILHVTDDGRVYLSPSVGVTR